MAAVSGEERTGRQCDLGLLQVFTGDGKGKTTAALGEALRAVGHGLYVLVIQFMKGRPTGELEAARRLQPYLTFLQYGSGRFIANRQPEPWEIELARSGLQRAVEALVRHECDMLILDELSPTLKLGLLPLGEVMDVLLSRPPGVEVIVTGRDAPPELVEAADLVTEVRMVKHPYQKGIPARKGTEF